MKRFFPAVIHHVPIWLALLIVSGLSPGVAAADNTISTVVGSGVPGFNEGYLTSNETQLNKPGDVAIVDNQGTLYIADTFNHRIRMLYRNWGSYYVKTVAGSQSTPGFSGDGGPAIQARLNNPWGVALDNKGNLYIADTDNHRIRRVDAGGTITTVAGNGNAGNAGDGGVATAAELNAPTGIAVDDSGNLYIVDSNNHVIRKVDATGVITRVAGKTAQAGFSGDGGRAIEATLNWPKRLAVTKNGFYIVDKGNHRIRRVDTSGIITTVVGNGEGYGGDNAPPAAAQLKSPSDIVVDARGNLFIADTGNHRIRKVNAATNLITTIAGSIAGFRGDGGNATQAELNYPDGLAIDNSGNLYIADTDNHRVRKIEGASSGNEAGGVAVTENLWMKAVIQTEERGAIEAVWKLGGDSKTSRGDRVIWGHFYASPSDVTWGSKENPDMFVKIWYDVSGRVDVNFFHVSVPEIEVYSAMAEIKKEAAYSRSTMQKRYVRHTYRPADGVYETEVVDTVEGKVNTSISESPTRHPLPFHELGLGTYIQTEEKGAINGVWKLGGSENTSRGDQVAWGFFYASPTDVTWGSADNPDVYVKVWVDVSGRIDVNFFHVSVPDIKVYSGHSKYEQQGVTTLTQRYTRHEYRK